MIEKGLEKTLLYESIIIYRSVYQVKSSVIRLIGGHEKDVYSTVRACSNDLGQSQDLIQLPRLKITCWISHRYIPGLCSTRRIIVNRIGFESLDGCENSRPSCLLLQIFSLFCAQ